MNKIQILSQTCYRQLLSYLRIKIMRLRRGRPFKYQLRKMCAAVLMRLRTGLPLRTIASLYGLSLATLWRWTNTFVGALAEAFEREKVDTPSVMRIDTTSTRTRTTDQTYCTGNKKARVTTVQVLCDTTGQVHSVS